MNISKKTILISLLIVALVASTAWIIISSRNNPVSEPAPAQSREETTPEDTPNDESVEEDNGNNNQDNSADIPEEVPPQEVDDRGGYTPY